MTTSPAQSVRQTKPLILIVDAKGFLGKKLAEKLSVEASIVFVGKESPDKSLGIIFIPITHLTPQIPHGTYSEMVVVHSRGQEHILGPLLQKAKEDTIQLTILSSKDTYHDAKQEAESLSEKSQLLVIGDVFGKDWESPLATFLYHAKKTKRIELDDMGLALWYPVFLGDALDLLAAHIMSFHKTPEVFVGPSHGITALSIAHAIQKVDPEVQIDFSEGDSGGKAASWHFAHGLTGYKSIEKLQMFYKKLTVQKKISQHVSSSALLPRKKNKTNVSWIAFMLYACLIFSIIPFMVLLSSTGLGMLFLNTSLSNVKKGDWKNASSSTYAAQTFFSVAKSTESITDIEASFTGMSGGFALLRRQIDLGLTATDLAEEGIAIAKNATDILGGKTLAPQDSVNQIIASEKHIDLLLQGVSEANVPRQYKDSFSNLQTLSGIASQVIDELPELLGVTGTKTYLVLFQNNMELRPGGGFIGSYGILKLVKGKIEEFSIHDVYDADGQLKGHVEPPFAIRRYIPIVHLYLRDSNFDVDFTKNAEIASYLLSQETGIKPDGVIGVDLDMAKALLASVGSVYVPSANTTVTPDNFFLTAESKSEKNFFPGSTQKKDFLNSFFAALQEKIVTKGVNIQVLLDQLTKVIQQKHLLFAFGSPLVEDPFDAAGLSSSLTDNRNTKNELNDFLGISEANLGINKVNAFMQRALDQKVIVHPDGSIDETVSLALTNSSTGDWPGGIYRNYIRFILPSGGVLTKISLNNVDQQIVDAVTNPAVYEAKSFTPPKGLEVQKTTEENKTLYGFLVSVPAKSTTVVAISYTLSQKIPITIAPQIYSISLLKQPGTEEYPYSLTLSLPQNSKLQDTNEHFVQNGNDYTLNTVLSGDTVISPTVISQ